MGYADQHLDQNLYELFSCGSVHRKSTLRE